MADRVRVSIYEQVALYAYVTQVDARRAAGSSSPIDSFRKLQWKQRRQAATDGTDSLIRSGDSTKGIPESAAEDNVHEAAPALMPSGVETVAEPTTLFDEFINAFVASDVTISNIEKLHGKQLDPHGVLSIPSKREGNSLTLCTFEQCHLLVVFGGRLLKDITQLLPNASAIDPLKLERIAFHTMLRGRQFAQALRARVPAARQRQSLRGARVLRAATNHVLADWTQRREFSTDEAKATKKTPTYTDEFIGKTGAEIFHETLAELGVDVVFGYPGGAILPVFDAIHESEHFEFILTRHEQGAGHMAQGYARATGKPGVVLVTSGPGATNTVTPLQDALMDGTPIVVFSGQVATQVLGSDAFQEADILGITRPCTKWNVQVRNVKDLARNIREAFHIATTGRPGPVLVDLPKDITAGLCKVPVTKEPQLLGYYGAKKVEGNRVDQEANLKKAVELINKAKKPIIYAGAGALHASEELRALARNANIPVTTSLQGMGSFDERDPLSLHMLGMHGSAYANKAIQDADLILAVGARFDDRVTCRVPDFAPEARRAGAEGRGGIVHFDISAKQIGKIVPATVGVVGDTKYNLQQIIPHVESKPRSEWHRKLQEWKARYPFRYRPSEPGAPLKAQRVIEELYTQTKHRDDVIITTGVGQHQMWAAQFYRWSRPNSIITSGGLGTMGFGLPSAIGAKVAKPNSLVVDIDGDASFMMTLTEMATAAEFNIGVKVLLLNNDFQGMVKQWQDLFYEERYSGTVMKNPNFVKFAEAMNCEGIRCSDEKDLPEAMAKFLAADGPILGEFVVEKNEHCLPMVGAGRALDEMIIGDFDDCPPTTSV
ncbi:hypothetical protein Poli38472_008496 [Pythium oligandrum]|uniref:Acetolactate synthase n=1 Tax=Pythium oligandrum TaxID=41045 RepID=A0A8K1C3N2_PYTOL|nr:hypothetical protein Poli38472_008496 [Pythium oligandrum]|eukprot:TMW55848.1 hypothetical protein Poli38472_008496 [Pythium oligandrum]